MKIPIKHIITKFASASNSLAIEISFLSSPLHIPFFVAVAAKKALNTEICDAESFDLTVLAVLLRFGLDSSPKMIRFHYLIELSMMNITSQTGETRRRRKTHNNMANIRKIPIEM